MEKQEFMISKMKMHIKPSWKWAFLSAILIGMLIHMPIMLSDFPNHDGLDSIYFDQNMITSGRWFLTIACGISSYYTLPWVIGLLGMFYLGIAAICIVEFLEVESKINIVLISGLLVSFPALASTFAYVFTLDGYMLGVLFAVLAPLLVKRHKYGFVAGGVALALSLGIYQAYLPFAMILSLYGIVQIALSQMNIREKIGAAVRYLFMGIEGAGLYFIVLQILLQIQGKQLASYQGINGVGSIEKIGIVGSIKKMYVDFVMFTFNGGVLTNNMYSKIAFGVIIVLVLWTLMLLIKKRRLYASIWFYLVLIALAIVVPLCSNVMLLISPDVTYHSLMRYQWILFVILAVAFIEGFGIRENETYEKLGAGLLGIFVGILVFNYAITDNIAYSNLEKKYEKTYALCIRLADRMEQTAGYYQGIPVAMIGVVGDEHFPTTDITAKVTEPLVGMSGDYLIYTRTNYQAFFKNYLGITINLVSDEEMREIYDSAEYQAMESFPLESSVQVVNGILYIKLENSQR